MMPTWAYAFAAATLFMMGAATGSHFQHVEDVVKADALVAAAVKAEKLERARTDKVNELADQGAARAVLADQQKNIAIVKEIDHVVQRDTSRAGFADAVRVLNNAAASGLPVSAPAGPPDDSPGAIEAVAGVVTENIAQCRADLGRFVELQQWIEGIEHDGRSSNSAGDGRGDGDAGGHDPEVGDPGRNPPGGDGGPAGE